MRSSKKANGYFTIINWLFKSVSRKTYSGIAGKDNAVSKADLKDKKFIKTIRLKVCFHISIISVVFQIHISDAKSISSEVLEQASWILLKRKR